MHIGSSWRSLCLTRIGMHTQIRFRQSFSAGRPPSGLGFEIQRTRDTSATHRAYVTTHRAGTTFLHHMVVSCVHILCLSVGNTTVIFPTTKGSWLSPSAGKALRSCLCLVNYKYKKFKITYILKPSSSLFPKEILFCTKPFGKLQLIYET